MIQPIVTDPEALSMPCVECMLTFDHVVIDLMDTAKYHDYKCAGLAANQIGHFIRVIVVKIKNKFVPMVNPEILHQKGKQVTMEEGCLSFPGKATRKNRRNKITISYFDPVKNLKVAKAYLKGFEARIVLHEIDHLNGILI